MLLNQRAERFQRERRFELFDGFAKGLFFLAPEFDQLLERLLIDCRALGKMACQALWIVGGEPFAETGERPLLQEWMVMHKLLDGGACQRLDQERDVFG